MNFTRDAILQRLTAAYSGKASTEEGTFAGDILRACADILAELHSMEIDGLEQRAFVSTAVGDWLTKVCADRGVERRDGESDEELRRRTLVRLSGLPASGNADHYAAWCGAVEDILRVRVLPLNRGAGTVDIVAVDFNGKCPVQTVLDEAQAIVDEERPIGADAQVMGAAEAPLDIAAAVVLMDGADISGVQTAFTASLGAFCRDNALLTDTVSYAKVLRLLLDTAGVADVKAFTLNGGEESLTLEKTAVAVSGTVSLTEENA